MISIRSVVHAKPVSWDRVILLTFLVVLTSQVAAVDGVVVIGDGRWRDCSNSGGIPYGDAAGNYGGCIHEGWGQYDASISPADGLPVAVGGGSSELVAEDIPEDLKCALDKYLHGNIKLTGGRTMRKVNAWAFGLRVGNSYYYQFRSVNVSPGGDWKPVGGSASSGTAYGRLYNRAFQPTNNFHRTGVRPGEPNNSLIGNLSAFETSLFAAAHEASHLMGKANNEPEADWYGIDAVQRYRSDGGKKCGK